MSEDRPTSLLKAVSHYVKRLEALQSDEDIELILTQFTHDELKKTIEVQKELIEYFTKGQISEIDDRIDRYRLPLHLALTCYVNDLKKYKEEIKKKLGDATPPDKVDKELQRFEELQTIFSKQSQCSYF